MIFKWYGDNMKLQNSTNGGLKCAKNVDVKNHKCNKLYLNDKTNIVLGEYNESHPIMASLKSVEEKFISDVLQKLYKNEPIKHSY